MLIGVAVNINSMTKNHQILTMDKLFDTGDSPDSCKPPTRSDMICFYIDGETDADRSDLTELYVQ